MSSSSSGTSATSLMMGSWSGPAGPPPKSSGSSSASPEIPLIIFPKGGEVVPVVSKAAPLVIWTPLGVEKMWAEFIRGVFPGIVEEECKVLCGFMKVMNWKQVKEFQALEAEQLQGSRAEYRADQFRADQFRADQFYPRLSGLNSFVLTSHN